MGVISAVHGRRPEEATKRPVAKKTTRKPAAKRAVARRAPVKKKTRHLLPVPDSRATALAWFANLSSRIFDAGVPELQALIAEARTYDLVGLGDALGDDAQVMQLNGAANELIQAGLDTFGSASPQGSSCRCCGTFSTTVRGDHRPASPLSPTLSPAGEREELVSYGWPDFAPPAVPLISSTRRVAPYTLSSASISADECTATVRLTTSSKP